MWDSFWLWYQFKGVWSVSGGEHGILVVVEFVGLVGSETGFRCLN